MLFLLLSVSITLSIIFLFLNHPLSMGLILFLQAISMCLISGYMSLSFWFSYVLLLIYLGGMLVLFMYMASIASNEMFKIKFNKIILIIYFMIMLSAMMYMTDKMMFTEMIKNTETMNMKHSINFKEMSISLMKLYNNPTIIITIMMMIYLFIALLAVVKITNINQGPMRKMNK
uniref:NADH-ubiquinone oxidoreductase chain 6 n=1 Tax=Gastrimargus marmoratus TaxID=267434 RepID=B8QGV4_9ORTH|nr:NADH dehydrogenase subunit 6 [Gastrimargus marmoratus]